MAEFDLPQAQEAVSFSDFDASEQQLVALATLPSRKQDHLLKVQFYKHAELNAYETKLRGVKKYDEFVYVRIQSPANRLNVIERRITDEDKTRFPKQYAQFLQGAKQLASGTPLDVLPTITASQMFELQALGVDTVEQLGQMPDGTAQILGTGGMELKLRAQRFLVQLQSADETTRQLNSLQQQLAELRAANAALEAKMNAEAGSVQVTDSAGKTLKV